MAMRILHEDLFTVDESFLGAKEHAELFEYLCSVPLVNAYERSLASTLVLAPPVADGATVEGRAEGCAGWPVWTSTGPMHGVDVPSQLSKLLERAFAQICSIDAMCQLVKSDVDGFTSLYVDRYPKGGSFVAHCDRACYGEIIAGVSIGPGTCGIHFAEDDRDVFSCRLTPGSLYAFAGRLRNEPCSHRVDGVSDLRFVVTMRQAANGLSKAGR